ncbi:MAG TPA: GatB/YqeY domain-containing protein [Planctomycetota bacterium]|jgi:hypothetical protein|nr:GatB/YqeY domain-containing protein [Planctomycetota bacterium]MDP7245664.1 GatB/YqeY domain-containing protein [Planctomycetota bacterium]HJM40145.1 GatB/YqeY domain-containing protein [Planctomycetota bacterium]|tara:strand:+ start:17753 stop:18238 length:486 start_codon:yes stop_codon:yes gene_type:complete
MSETTDRLASDVKESMRNRDKARTECLRGLLSELKNAGIEKKGSQGVDEEKDNPADYLSEDEVIKSLQKVCKRRKEAAQMFIDGDRQDLADQDLAEVVIIEEYLPKGLAPEDLEALLKEVIAEVGAESMKDMGAVMKAAGPKIAGRADGRAVSEVVRALLG